MPKQSGGAQQLRRGDRVRVVLNGSYRLHLDGLEGRITCVLHHGVIVALDNDPVEVQRILGTNTAPNTDQTQGRSSPKNPTLPQRTFQFHEIEKVNP